MKQSRKRTGTGRRDADARRKRVLLVDDSPVTCYGYSELLLREGYVVMKASGGEEALRIVAGAATELDLLITCLKLPGMSGVDLVARIGEELPYLPIMLMSESTADLRLASVMLPWVKCHRKTTDPANFIKFVGALLARTSLKDE